MKLCLNMIVKNEVRILERCLASVAPWIDAYVIGDTGSTDGTQNLITSFFAKHSIKGEIHSLPFEDFSQARNASLELCRASGLAFDYILLCDADMELVVEDVGFTSKLAPPQRRAAYLLRQITGISYDNIRLVQRDLPARYVGATHEYLDTCGTGESRLEGVHFIDHAEGSSRSEKFERDARLLEGSLKKNPNDVRAMFYLAQTFKDLGRWKEAAVCYQKRAQADGFPEEAWYASYMRARCLKELGDESGFIAQALTAYQMRPHRSEPLLLLATYFREKGRNELALLMTRTGERIDFPKDDKLFIEDFAYEHGFRYEKSIAGFYSIDRETRQDAYDACQHLVTSRDTPCWIRDISARNTVHYAKNGQEAFGASFNVCEIASRFKFCEAAMNPSVCATEDGQIFCNIRWVNYRIEQGRYVIQTPDGKPDDVIRTENEIISLGWNERGELQNEKSFGLISDKPGETKTNFPVQGYEDCRLFRFSGRWWASATVRDRHPDGRAEIAVLALRQDHDESFVIKDVHVQKGTWTEEGHQKNWVPLVRIEPKSGNEELLFLYSADPTILLAFDPLTNQSREVTRYEPRLNLQNLRGSSQAVPFTLEGESGWLYVAHEAFDMDGRWYTHRLVWLDEHLRIQRVSDPFYFFRKGIEFCAGLAIAGKKVIFSFGVQDAKAYLATVDCADIRAWLLQRDNR